MRQLKKLDRGHIKYKFTPKGRKIRHTKGDWHIPDLKLVPKNPRKVFKTPDSAKQYKKQRRRFIQHNAKVKLMHHLKTKNLITDSYDYYSHWNAKVLKLRLMLQKETGRFYRIAKVPVRKRKYFFKAHFSVLRISAMLLDTSRVVTYLNKARADALTQGLANGIVITNLLSLRPIAPGRPHFPQRGRNIHT